jgi:hypothetical protein
MRSGKSVLCMAAAKLPATDGGNGSAIDDEFRTQNGLVTRN